MPDGRGLAARTSARNTRGVPGRAAKYESEDGNEALTRECRVLQVLYNPRPMAATKAATGEKLIASNKKALHEYFVLQKLEAGVSLTGTEVKSLREGQANLKDSYVIVKNGEAWLLGTHISADTHGNRENHDPVRTRKLLLHKREIEKLHTQLVEKGLTIVPLRLY